MGDYYLDFQAQRDLRDILEFISDHSILAAERTRDRLENTFLGLAANPYLGQERPELEAGLRSFPVNPYTIIYRPLDGGVIIVRVIHGSRDITHLI